MKDFTLPQGEGKKVCVGGGAGFIGSHIARRLKAAGWYGWPYYQGNNKAYYDGNASPWSVTTMRSDLNSYFNLASFTGSGASAGDSALLGTPQPA